MATSRIDALLSRLGYCSRKEATLWVKHGRITANGEPVKSVSQKVKTEDVLIDGESPDAPHGVCVALNKPVGYTCSRNTEEGTLIYDILPERWLRRNPSVTTVGRLDKETSGLIIITDNGKLVHQLTSPKKHVEKTYELTTSEDIPHAAIALLASGSLLLPSEDAACLPAKLNILAPRHAMLTLTEGKYHQVRRMMEQVGAPVLSLHRISIGGVRLSDLYIEEGEWTEISPDAFFM